MSASHCRVPTHSASRSSRSPNFSTLSTSILAAIALGALAPTDARAATCTTSFTYYYLSSCATTDPSGSANMTMLDLGSRLLERMGNAATWGVNAANNANPGGGGAPAQTGPRYRAYFEGYGLWSTTAPQGAFVGDNRRTFGGVAGFSYAFSPSFTFGATVDQSHSGIDIPNALQSANVDLTQIGVNAVYTHGPWTFVAAGVHGFGRINSRRLTAGPSTAVASYGGTISGAIAEISYYHAIGQGRLIPKLALEYARSHTDGFSETGGLPNFTVSSANGERARLLIGAEIGRYWIVDQHVIDLSAYGKFVDNFMQRAANVSISGVTVQGFNESQLGADAGASLSYGINRATRVYANYDGKFRTGFTSHSGTVGLELRW